MFYQEPRSSGFKAVFLKQAALTVMTMVMMIMMMLMSDDHDVDAPDCDNVGKYDDCDDNDVHVVECSCTGYRWR